MSQPIRLILVGDHQLFRECLASALTAHENITVVDLATDALDAYNKAKAQQPDILLIDIGLPNNVALDLTKQIRLEMPQVKVIALGLLEEEAVILQYVEAGVNGYVLKEASLDDLITAIRLVHRGEAICSPRIAYSMFSRAAELAQEGRRTENFDTASLTPREMEVLELLAQGLSNRQIAQHLFLSVHTVKNHVHSVLDKLHAGHRSEAVRYALLKGLLKKNHAPLTKN
jgi:DNA-binding NarL/FixJ family response regulator